MIERNCVAPSIEERGDVQARHWLEPFVILLGRAVLVQMGAEHQNSLQLGLYRRKFHIRNVRYLPPSRQAGFRSKLR